MKKSILTVSVASVLCLFSCKKAMLNEAVNGAATGLSGVSADALAGEKILQEANPNVKIGAAISVSRYNAGGAYADLVNLHYNSITAENAMKMNTLQPSEDNFNFSDYTIQNLCLNNGKKRMHGHVLIWHAALPTWVKNWETATLPAGVTRYQKFDSIMSKHIRKVIYNYGHPNTQFKDDNGKLLMKSWDVVNEAFNDNGTYRSAKNVVNGDDKGSIWYRMMGQGYIQKAFSYARKYANANGDTALKLFYNDYGHEYSTAKLDSIYKMVMALKANTVNGKPIIDGIGMQMHIGYSTPNSMIKAAFIKMASTGLLIHFAELDINLNYPNTTPLSSTELNNRLALQKQKFMDVAFLYRKYVPAAQRWGITTWNVGDKDSWLTYNASGTQIDSPCLYDINYTKKDAFYYFWDGLNLDIPASY
jgi:endo-1,4-beta-xylanase